MKPILLSFSFLKEYFIYVNKFIGNDFFFQKKKVVFENIDIEYRGADEHLLLWICCCRDAIGDGQRERERNMKYLVIFSIISWVIKAIEIVSMLN